MTTYQAICSCGYRGRSLKNPNAAVVIAENHGMKFDPFQGGRSDGRRHRTDVQEVTKGDK